MSSPVGMLSFDDSPIVAQEIRRKPTGRLIFDEEEPASQEPQTSEVEQKISEHIKLREGSVNKSYKDRDVLSAGIGHQLSKEELALYPEGTEVDQEQIDSWFAKDSKKAISAARKQAKEIGNDSEELLLALSSVNFQLGPSWNKEHKNTWKLLKEGKYTEAAEEAERSEWFKQTPTRVKDFQEALRSVASQAEYASMDDGWYRDKETNEEFEVKGGERL